MIVPLIIVAECCSWYSVITTTCARPYLTRELVAAYFRKPISVMNATQRFTSVAW